MKQLFLFVLISLNAIAMDVERSVPDAIFKKLVEVGKTMGCYADKSLFLVHEDSLTTADYMNMSFRLNEVAKGLWNSENDTVTETDMTFQKNGDDDAPANIGFIAKQGVGGTQTQFGAVVNSANFVKDAFTLFTFDPSRMQSDDDRFLFWGLFSSVINKISLFPTRQYLGNFKASFNDDGKIGPLTASEKEIFGWRHTDSTGRVEKTMDSTGRVTYSRGLSKKGKEVLKKYTNAIVAAKWNLALNIDAVNTNNLSSAEISDMRMLRAAIGYSGNKFSGRVFRGSITSPIELGIMFSKGQYFYLPSFVSTSIDENSARWEPITDSDGVDGKHNIFYEIDTSDFYEYSCLLQDDETYFPEEKENLLSANNIYAWDGIRLDRDRQGQVTRFVVKLKIVDHWSTHSAHMKTVSETVAKLKIDHWFEKLGERHRTKRMPSAILTYEFIKTILSLYRNVLEGQIQSNMCKEGCSTKDQKSDFEEYKKWLRAKIKDIAMNPEFSGSASYFRGDKEARSVMSNELKFSDAEIQEIMDSWQTIRASWIK